MSSVPAARLHAPNLSQRKRLKMYSEDLILAVFENSPLWNRRDKLHSNRNVIEKCWKEISEKLNEDENKLRKKWKYLRDQFAVELGKVTRSGDTGDLPASKWPYFQSLLFLKDVVKPRPSPGHLSKVPVSVELATGTSDEPQLQSEDPDAYLDYSESPDETSTPFPPQNEETDEDDVGRNNVGNSTYHPSSVCSESSSNRGRKRKHRITDPFNEPVSSIERQKRFYLEEKLSNNRREVDEDDENLHFFKSLLPHVRKIPNCKLLSFRNCVQELVQQYAYEECVKTQNIPP